MLASALLIAVLYILILFGVAWITDKRSEEGRAPKLSSTIYGLSLGVYFTSWTFFGAVGTAARSGWDYLPIYLGPLIVMTVGFPLVRRMVHLGRSFHSTSIADFLSTRYGKSSGLAAFVTLIAVMGTIPYIALQLRSVSMTFTALAGPNAFKSYDIVPIVAVLLAGFAILFGTRHVDTTEPKRGLVAAIALENAVKIMALLLVTGFVLVTYSGADLRATFEAAQSPFQLAIGDRFLTLVLISMASILCLPRQFHLMVVECQRDRDIRIGRRVFILSLLITIAVVIPISLAGLQSHLPGSPDLFVLSLPLHAKAGWLAVVVFLGGFSAATGMVVVSTIALSTMVTNDLLFGALLRRSRASVAREVVGGQTHLMVRRLVIGVLLALATVYHLGVRESDALASLGILSFAAVTQFAPALVGGLYWKRGHKRGVVMGLSAGFICWFFLLVIPAYHGLGYDHIIASTGADPLTTGVMVSLLANILLYIGGSLTARPAVVDRMQAAAFTEAQLDTPTKVNYERGAVTMADLKALMERCLGKDQTNEALKAFELVGGRILLDADQAAPDIIGFAERKIAGVLGTASARILMRSVMTGDDLAIEDIATVLGETQEKLQFSHELLQATLDNMNQSVSVVDTDLKLVAWNQRYLDMFDYPADFIRVGRPIADVIRFNATRGMFGAGDSDEFVERRLSHMRAGNPHAFERTYADGRVLQIYGNPMPGGGYVTTFTDITETKKIEQQLKAINETLEERVAERTQALHDANSALEEATKSKTRFLAAASHDLLQPLNAARLFGSALEEELGGSVGETARTLMEKLDRSILSADRLIRALLDISRLDTGVLQPVIRPFALADILDDLVNEQSVAAEQKGLVFSYVPTGAVVRSDKGLVTSVLQNLVSNAVRYTETGRVLVGVRHRGRRLSVQVWDTGPGIAPEDQQEIFKEFVRLNQTSHQTPEPIKGMGLGLAITERIARRLGLDLSVTSVPGKGSLFEISLEIADAPLPQPGPARTNVRSRLAGLRILCVDNDAQVLDGQATLLARWGCTVDVARSGAETRALYDDDRPEPDIVLLDYQLDAGETGPDVYAEMLGYWQSQPPAILITADHHLPEGAAPQGPAPVLHKPITPAILRAVLEQTAKTLRQIEEPVS